MGDERVTYWFWTGFACGVGFSVTVICCLLAWALRNGVYKR